MAMKMESLHLLQKKTENNTPKNKKKICYLMSILMLNLQIISIILLIRCLGAGTVEQDTVKNFIVPPWGMKLCVIFTIKL